MPFLIEIVIALAIVGLILWVISQVPMDATIAKIIRVIVIVFVCIWLLSVLVPMLSTGTAPLFPLRR